MTDHYDTSLGTINCGDADVTQVAAALADACLAGGLSDAYYRKADAALKRIASLLSTLDETPQEAQARREATATAEAAQDRITRAALERARAEITESRAEQLGQRAVACKHWRWMAGMHTLSGQRVLDIPEDGGPGRFQASILSADDSTGARAVCLLSEWGSELPDTVDPSTRGCLLALVREAHDDPHAHVDYSDDTPTEPWWCWAGDSVSRAATETKALVAALEAAP